MRPILSVMSGDEELAALLCELRDHLGFRRIEQGIRRLESLRPLLEALGPEVKDAGTLVGLTAQWVDAGFDTPELIRRLLDKFPRRIRSALPLVDYLHLRMAEGLIAMSEEEFDRAVGHFLFVQSLEEVADDPELLAIANFWTCRCLRKAGRYDDALEYAVRGEELALSCGYTQMAAIMQVTESWLAFQKGKLHEAVTILRRAEEALSQAEDYLTRGNIQSAYGRVARRQGRYDHAVEYFERAIAEYRRGGGGQMQHARALLNLAFVKRLLALDVQKGLDQISASRRSAADAARNAELIREKRVSIEQIRSEAVGHLAEAMPIYVEHENHRGIAGVHINTGFLHLDAGDLECAALEAGQAFHHGHEKHDFIVMARARTLQTIIENQALDEQVGDSARHHEAAEMFAREAVNFAGQTQNRRLLSRALVWQGLTFTAEPASDLDAARRCCEQAMALLQPEGGERQYVWDDLELLKTRVLHARPVDPILRAWSAGVVHGKTFQELTEEFARIVIPKVWEREGRKISRVAETLSMSPKKVRRILNAAGLLERPATHTRTGGAGE